LRRSRLNGLWNKYLLTIILNGEGKMDVFLGITLGGLFGFLYYRLVGCSTGSCPITSNPWISILYGAVIGFLFTQA
jgi:hypothetical protein